MKTILAIFIACFALAASAADQKGSAPASQDNFFVRAAKIIGHDAKTGAKEAGQDLSQAGKDVGHGTVKVLKEIGDGVVESAKKTGKAAKDLVK